MKTALLASLGRYRDFGLLVLRVGLGVMFIFRGYGKVIGGPERWQELGTAMGHVGIHVLPTLWGALAALAEFGGGILLILGLFSRLAAIGLLATMGVAAVMHLSEGDGLARASHAIELAFVFFGLVFLGPGAHSVDGR